MEEAYQKKLRNRMEKLVGPKRKVDVTSRTFMQDLAVEIQKEYKSDLLRLFRAREAAQAKRDRLHRYEDEEEPKEKPFFKEDSDDEWTPFYSEESDDEESSSVEMSSDEERFFREMEQRKKLEEEKKAQKDDKKSIEVKESKEVNESKEVMESIEVKESKEVMETDPLEIESEVSETETPSEVDVDQPEEKAMKSTGDVSGMYRPSEKTLEEDESEKEESEEVPEEDASSEEESLALPEEGEDDIISIFKDEEVFKEYKDPIIEQMQKEESIDALFSLGEMILKTGEESPSDAQDEANNKENDGAENSK